MVVLQLQSRIGKVGEFQITNPHSVVPARRDETFPEIYFKFRTFISPEVSPEIQRDFCENVKSWNFSERFPKLLEE